MDFIQNNAQYIAVTLAIVVGFCGYLLGRDAGARVSAGLTLDALQEAGIINIDSKDNITPGMHKEDIME